MAKQRKKGKETITERAKLKVEGAPLIVETSTTYTPGRRVNPLKYRFQLYHEITGETLLIITESVDRAHRRS